MNKGFIMLYKDLDSFEWYTDQNTFKVFMHCLLKVNYSEKKWQGHLIRRGEFITSYEKLAVENGLTVSKVRTALTKLKTTGYITVETNNSFSRIAILGFNSFVAEGKGEQNDTRNDTPISTHVNIPNSSSIPNEQHSIDKQLATTNTNNKEEILNRKKIFRERVFSHTKFNKDILESFYMYWSELNTEQTEMRFEKEKFFEIQKRLKKWLANERPKRMKAKSQLHKNR